MKKILLPLAIMVCLSAQADIRTWQRSNYLRQQQAERDWAAGAPARAAAREQMLWRAANPWWASADWRNATNQIAQLQILISKNTTELNLLNGAGESNSSRAKTLQLWINNERTALNAAYNNKSKIEGQWNLNSYYRTNQVVK